MACFNDFNNNANFYSTSSASAEFNVYPFLSQASATEEADSQTYSTLADRWSMVGYPGRFAD